MSDPAPEPPRPELDPGVLDRVVADSAADEADSIEAQPQPQPATAAASEASGESEAAPVDAGPATPDDAADGSDAETEAASGALAVDVSDPDAEALSAIPLATRIEALLFAATEPLPLKKLRDLTGCPDGRAVREAVESLAARCVQEERAYRVEEVAQGWQLRTAGAVAVVVARLGRRPAEDRLSTAALETLAIVAYRQPVLRVDVERIRGVACGEVLRALQERGLVRVAGRADLPGSPLLYGTTQRFLEVFGLRDVQDLPRDRELLRPKPDA